MKKTNETVIKGAKIKLIIVGTKLVIERVMQYGVIASDGNFYFDEVFDLL